MTGPRYPNSPIGSISALAWKLGMSERELRRLADRAPRMHRLAGEKAQAEAGGEGKVVYDPCGRLKFLQQRINKVLLGAVEFPDYLNGGIRGRSYRDDSARHTKSETVIKMDIRVFYESVRAEHVRELWQHFFRFPPDVAELLTRLTTHKGALPRGGPASGNLANLIFWDIEPQLVEKLAARDATYSRYVDDVTISAPRRLSRVRIGEMVGQVYGAFFRKGLCPNRDKLKIMFGNGPLRVHGVNVNAVRPTIPKSIRHEIRASVEKFVRELERNAFGSGHAKQLDHLQGKLGWMGMFHSEQAEKLQEKLRIAVEKARKQPPS